MSQRIVSDCRLSIEDETAVRTMTAMVLGMIREVPDPLLPSVLASVMCTLHMEAAQNPLATWVSLSDAIARGIKRALATLAEEAAEATKQ